jgi:AcrR family transcriptional regulator
LDVRQQSARPYWLDFCPPPRNTVLIGSVSERNVKKSDVKRQAILETASRLFRTQGFDKTSVSQITAEVGGSKATIYSHFSSKEEIFVECMTATANDYIAGIASQSVAKLDDSGADPGVLLRHYGTGYLKFICSPDIVAARRLLIAEAARSGIGRLFLAKIAAMRVHVMAFLAQLMASRILRPDDTRLAAEHLRALLEAEILEPLLLEARDDSPGEGEIALAVDRAVAAFLRAYAP